MFSVVVVIETSEIGCTRVIEVIVEENPILHEWALKCT